MAFVYRSTRTNFQERNRISIGPGEYDEEFSKTQGRLLHMNNLKYSTIMKNTKTPVIIPFNTTSQRSKLFDGDNRMPGPGTYSLASNMNNTNPNTKSLFGQSSNSIEKDLQEIMPMFSTNKKGFLSSERRFNKSSPKEKISPGPGSYDIKSNFATSNISNNPNNKYLMEKYAINKGKMYKLPGSSGKTSSIPDKSKGEFKIVKGLLTEFKKEKYDEGLVGPGKYNLFSNWNTHGIVWDKTFKKEDKSKINESEIQKELELNSTILNNENYSEKMHNINNFNSSSTLSTNINLAQKSKNLSSVYTNGNINTSNNIGSNSKPNNINFSCGNTVSNLNYNSNSFKNINKNKVEGQIRNRIFHNFIKNKEELHFKTMSKLKDPNNLILDLEYKELPGPGFYNQNIIPKHISFTSTAQNFGSNSPKFKMLKTENEIIGPGSYFKERNKYQPKFKPILHAKIPEKQKREKNESVFVQNLRNNEEKMPGPGEYNLEGKLIKKEISSINSFGSVVERFKFSKTTDEENHNSSNIKEYINQSLEEENKKDRDRIKESLYLKKVEKIKKKEKKKRQKYLTKKMPSVGTYSPEATSSIYYNVLSKLNPYRNQLAPFNIINSRFSQIKNPRFKNVGTPGPAEYNVEHAFQALNSDKRKYNIFGQNKQRESRIKNTFVPGPGGYNLDNPNFWNIKSYNVLFINNN